MKSDRWVFDKLTANQTNCNVGNNSNNQPYITVYGSRTITIKPAS